MLALISRPIKIVNVSTACTSGISLYTAAGNPTYPLNLYCFVSNTLNSSSTATPALRTGTALSNGTWVYIKNSNTITGASGTSGSGGAGGPAGGDNDTAPGGSSGGTGGTGGVAVLIEGNQFANLLDNGSGTITRGSGGSGGGGGGGGGGSYYIPATKFSPAILYSGGGGGGGAGSPVGSGAGPGGSPGTATTGGAGGAGPAGGPGGPGGNLGVAGSGGTPYPGAGPGGPGGPAGASGPIGNAITGNNKITYLANGTITGPVAA